MAKFKVVSPPVAVAESSSPAEEQSAIVDPAQQAADLLDAPPEAVDSLPAGTLEGWVTVPKADRAELENFGVVVLHKNPATASDADSVTDLFCRVSPEAFAKLELHWGRFHWALGEPRTISPDKPWEAEPTPPAGVTDEASETGETSEESPAKESQSAATAEQAANDASPSPNIIEPTKAEELLDEIAQAEEECAAAEAVVNNLKGELKEAKKDYETCVNRLRKLSRKAKDDERPLFKPRPQAAIATESPTTSAAETPETADSDAWRSVSITELPLENIKGVKVGGVRYTRLVDAVPTLGHLEDLRVAAGINGLHTVMPDNIGQTVTDQLEEMYLNWITQNRDKFEPQSAATASETESSGGDASEAVPAITAENWDTLTDEQQAEFLSGRATIISENMAGETNHLDQKVEGAHFWQSGCDAYNRGDEVKDCPVVPGPEQDDWLRGYFAAAEAAGDTEYEPSEEEIDNAPTDLEGELEAALSAPGSFPLIDIDDI